MTKRPTPAVEPGGIVSTDLQVAFGESVRAGRLKAGMSQTELSTRSGIGQKQISLIENGQVNLTIRTMTRLANVLDGDVTKMLQASRDQLRNP